MQIDDKGVSWDALHPQMVQYAWRRHSSESSKPPEMWSSTVLLWWELSASAGPRRYVWSLVVCRAVFGRHRTQNIFIFCTEYCSWVLNGWSRWKRCQKKNLSAINETWSNVGFVSAGVNLIGSWRKWMILYSHYSAEDDQVPW